MLSAPAATPSCGAVDQHVDAEAALPRLQQELFTHLAAALGLDAAPGEIDDAEMRLATELSTQRYGSREFTYRR